MLAVLQFDSTSLGIVERMLQDGRLPTLAALKERGRWSALEAATDLFEAGVYPTLYSGEEIADHGLYYPIVWSPAEQRLRYMDAFPKPETVWERLGRAGRRSLVIDPYQLWPTAETPGLTISGWQLRHKIIPVWAAPRREHVRLTRRWGGAPELQDVSGPRSGSGLLAMRGVLLAGPERAANLVADVLSRQSFDLVWVVFIGAHQAGHHLWDLSQIPAADLDQGDRRALETALEDVYAAVDVALGRIVAALPAEADVIVFSPIGMGPNTTRSDLLPDMLGAILAGKPTGSRGAEAAAGGSIWRVRDAVPVRWRNAVARMLPGVAVRELVARLYLRGVDWERTRAAVLPGDHFGYVRLNVRGRERRGIVGPAEMDALIDEISAGLLSFHDSDGTPTVAGVHRVAREMAGSRLDQLPDLVVRWSDRPSTRLTEVSSPRFGTIHRRGVGTGRSGNHAPGAWMLLAPRSSRIRDIRRLPQIVDVAATACHVLGADPTGLRGESLLETA